jgi:phage terminase large subunit GpA-like protein
MVKRVISRWAPPERLGNLAWAEKYRYLSQEEGARPGRYRAEVTPWIRGILAACDDPRVEMLVGMKAAQVAWTTGVLNNVIGRRIHLDPSPMVLMFPKEGAAREYGDEKFAPMVKATPVLAERVDLRARKDGNRALFKRFPGGFLKLVGSNSPSSVKSTPAPFVAVEEPDDANQNLRGQGDTIKLLEERKKTYDNAFMLYGGTPTIKSLSAVETAYEMSDQRRYYVLCPDCDGEQWLDWANVHWQEDPSRTDSVYGHGLPETATYVCPTCGSLWTDEARVAAVARGDWVASKPFNGVAGFHIPELLASWMPSRVVPMARKYLAARHKLESEGDEGDMIAFVNSQLGLPYEFGAGQVAAEALAERAEEYPELEVQEGGLIVTAGVDFQHDRAAIILRAWGRGEESWLLYWGELYGTIVDERDQVWDQLEARLFGPVRHVTGREMYVTAMSLDSSDGTTADAVYGFVRRMRKKYAHSRDHIMAIKGDSERAGAREIYTIPARRSIDPRRPTKADKHGLRPFLVGTSKAKDLILGTRENTGRINLRGSGPGVFHVYKDVRSDYHDQLLSEVKAPSRRHRGKMVWQQKAGQNNEGLDCEVYALHAARSRRTHVMTPGQWDDLERKLLQADLFAEPAGGVGASAARLAQVLTEIQRAQPADPQTKPKPKPAPRPAPSRSGGGGFGSDDWNL